MLGMLFSEMVLAPRLLPSPFVRRKTVLLQLACPAAWATLCCTAPSRAAMRSNIPLAPPPGLPSQPPLPQGVCAARPDDFRLVVMSATLDAAAFTRYFGGAKAAYVQARCCCCCCCCCWGLGCGLLWVLF